MIGTGDRKDLASLDNSRVAGYNCWIIRKLLMIRSTLNSLISVVRNYPFSLSSEQHLEFVQLETDEKEYLRLRDEPGPWRQV